MTTTTNYKAGQREVMRWLTGYGIRLTKIEDRGMQREDGWDHYAWTLTVLNDYGQEKQAVYQFPFKQGVGHTHKPTLVDIMAALLSDAACVLDRDFLEFCCDLGYDPDSRKAKAMYDTIIANNAKLCKLFRTTDLDGLLTRYEPLREAAGL